MAPDVAFLDAQAFLMSENASELVTASEELSILSDDDGEEDEAMIVGFLFVLFLFCFNSSTSGCLVNDGGGEGEVEHRLAGVARFVCVAELDVGSGG